PGQAPVVVPQEGLLAAGPRRDAPERPGGLRAGPAGLHQQETRAQARHENFEAVARGVGDDERPPRVREEHARVVRADAAMRLARAVAVEAKQPDLGTALVEEGEPDRGRAR